MRNAALAASRPAVVESGQPYRSTISRRRAVRTESPRRMARANAVSRIRSGERTWRISWSSAPRRTSSWRTAKRDVFRNELPETMHYPGCWRRNSPPPGPAVRGSKCHHVLVLRGISDVPRAERLASGPKRYFAWPLTGERLAALSKPSSQPCNSLPPHAVFLEFLFGRSFTGHRQIPRLPANLLTSLTKRIAPSRF